HDDLLDLRDRHHVLVAELLLESRDDVLRVFVSQSRAHLSTTPSHLRQIRTLRPSPRILWPTRVCAPHSGQTSCTLLACTDASRSTMPPLMFLPGFGFVWRLIMLTPSMIRRFLSGCTFSTRPRFPRSLPVMTSTLSFFRIGVAKLDIAENL